MKEWFIVGMVIVAGGWLVWWGDNHGFSARQLAEIKRQAAATNAKIEGFNARDEQAAIDADVLRSEGYQKALADLSAADKCIVTPAMIRAIGRINQ